MTILRDHVYKKKMTCFIVFCSSAPLWFDSLRSGDWSFIMFLPDFFKSYHGAHGNICNLNWTWQKHPRLFHSWGISTSSRLFISDRKLDVIAWEPNTLRGLIVSGGVLIIEYIWITSLAHHCEVKAPGNFTLRSRMKMSTSWKKNGMCAQSLCCSLNGYLRTKAFFMRGQRRLWSYCADAHADLSLRWAHMPFCWFCHALAQITLLLKCSWNFGTRI